MLAQVNLSDRLSFDVQGAQSLKAGAASGDQETLRAAAKQFEAMMVQIMLKSMRQVQFTGEGDVFGDSNTLKLYQELLDQQWAQTVVEGKGFGFADAIVRKLGVEADQGVREQRAAPCEACMNTQPAEMAREAEDVMAPAPGADTTSPQARFIQTMLPHARKAEAETGLPARFILAQAALESGWGKHEIQASDGRPSHNLFGIKATGWNGESVDTMTTEFRQGTELKVSQKFRVYADYAEGFTDYARLLKARYAGAVSAGEDAEAFAHGLANAGYASDPDYADKLRRTIASVTARMNAV